MQYFGIAKYQSIAIRIEKSQSIAILIGKNFKYCKKYCKNESIAKSIVKSAILYWILISNNYFSIIYLSLIYVYFFVSDSRWWIKLFPYVVCWIQKLCLLYNIFDEYNYIILNFFFNFDWSKYHTVFFCSMLWYGVVWNSIFFCIIFKVYFNTKYCSILYFVW